MQDPSCSSNRWMRKFMELRTVREEAEAYFNNGGRRAEHIALVLYQRHTSWQWSDIVKIVVQARKIHGA